DVCSSDLPYPGLPPLLRRGDVSRQSLTYKSAFQVRLCLETSPLRSRGGSPGYGADRKAVGNPSFCALGSAPGISRSGMGASLLRPAHGRLWGGDPPEPVLPRRSGAGLLAGLRRLPPPTGPHPRQQSAVHLPSAGRDRRAARLL